MIESGIYDELNPDLDGMRIGLSGAIPDPDEWEGRALDDEVLNAVTTLADTVFSGGGHLVHGSHPSFTPRILAQAEPYALEQGKPVVTFVLSGLFADGHLARQLRSEQYRDVLRLIVVEPVVPSGHDAEDVEARNASLAAMRQRLIDEMDALVVVGGKRWRNSPKRPGTLEELELARRRGIPCYLLGGLGGMTRELTAQAEFSELASGARTLSFKKLPNRFSGVPEEIASALTSRAGLLDNGLTPEDNRYLQQTTNYLKAIAKLGKGLEVSRVLQKGAMVER